MIICMLLGWLYFIRRILSALFLTMVVIVASSITISIVIAAPLLAQDPLAVEYDIVVHIDPVEQTIKGRSVIATTSSPELTLLLAFKN